MESTKTYIARHQKKISIYHKSPFIGAVTSGGVAPGGTGPKVVVGTGEPRLGERAGGGKGGRGNMRVQEGGQARLLRRRVAVAPDTIRE